VVLGEPGVGKSALVLDLVSAQQAVPASEAARVLRTAGVESESPLPFVALQRLLRPMVDFDRLPVPQAGANEPARAARLFTAARNAWASGQGLRARALSASARELTSDGLLRADIDRLRARIEVNVGSASDAHRIFVQAVRAPSMTTNVSMPSEVLFERPRWAGAPGLVSWSR
jgi:hypothetical protein